MKKLSDKKPQAPIIGIDPGTLLMGYGVVQEIEGKPALLAMGILRLNKYKSHCERLLKIHEVVASLIAQYRPEHLAIEAPFYGKNVQTTLKLGRAQGAAMVAAVEAGLEVTEYPPRTIKKAITGQGAASKEQVAQLLKSYLKISEESMMAELDATDGVAVALCHYLHMQSPLLAKGGGGKNSWEEYIRQNPSKIKHFK